MPELPEVETVRRGLEGPLVGRRLVRVVQRRADLRWPLPESFEARLRGRRVTRLDRRAKFLLAHLDDATVWMIHLGMSGRLFLSPRPTPPPGPHDHVVVETDRGDVVTYQDHRRFGMMDLVAAASLERHPLLCRLGPEPLGNSFDEVTLSDRLSGRRTPIKAALLDQRTVAGLGNIYVSEALYRAGISPRRLARTVAGRRAARLVPAIRQVLEDAIRAGGSSLRDYVQASGELGYFQHDFQVYDREGEACRRCGATVRRIVQSGRATYYCGGCQR
ncbi:MAG: bifunctional DNA-formamidopyrimidine glycosylase/DNA-(apurinic or apyrimidinic site) lyase [Alphaproteobacteria bacterium]|jgi:formamidopyrimidine-DNA glycosylase|nr:bifunctional DNA-formamidopyrimidine glycosylase/DNA-(apurinic or apyrimidinic site) lyase [Alphaproteobacteria bacterium]